MQVAKDVRNKENIQPRYGIDNNRLAAVPAPAAVKKVVSKDNIINHNAIQKLLEQQQKGTAEQTSH